MALRRRPSRREAAGSEVTTPRPRRPGRIPTWRSHVFETTDPPVSLRSADPLPGRRLFRQRTGRDRTRRIPFRDGSGSRPRRGAAPGHRRPPVAAVAERLPLLFQAGGEAGAGIDPQPRRSRQAGLHRDPFLWDGSLRRGEVPHVVLPPGNGRDRERVHRGPGLLRRERRRGPLGQAEPGPGGIQGEP